MKNRRTPLGSSGWETALRFSILLLHMTPLFTHDTSSFLSAVAARRDIEGGSSLLFNATWLNSSTSALRRVAFKSALPGEATGIPRAQVLVRKPREVEEPGSGIPGEYGTSASTPDFSAHLSEVEQLPATAVGGMGAGLPTRSGSRAQGRAQLDFKEEDTEESAPHWQSKILKADGSVLALDQVQPSALVPTQHPLHVLGSPGDGQVINVGFYKPDQGHQIDTPPPPHPQELQSRDPTSWTSDFYDYLSPDYSITEVYPDEALPTPVYMEDENVSSKRQPFAPEHGMSSYNPAGPVGSVDAEDGSACLPGFMRRNGTCQSPCDSSSSYCFNGGQCYTTGAGAFCSCNLQNYTWSKGTRCESVITDFQVMCFVVGGVSATVLLLFMVIVFFSKRLHLLKMENRRLRKRRSRPQSEQHIDTFSLSTAADGSQANKTMSQYTWECKSKEELSGEDTCFFKRRTGSCQHQDQRTRHKAKSTSTINQHQKADDTGKQEEPVQTPTKEDEALNIQNSLTPKDEDSKASCEDAEEGVATIDLELLLPKEVEMHPESSPQHHPNVSLCKIPQKSPVLHRPPGRSGQGRPLSQVYPRRGSEPGYSPVSTRSLPHLHLSTASPHLEKPSTP
ncbi:chondroitin sulfate proteoglycan 5b isoform X2 [Electrophorus electricus]|uniref:chondroitin sulfate proteoglycan 5b isoform X2 n=1 Tax=Electrophorus electricus TaxID=8005 RepID=UPI0015D02AD2|nr:chondroitin sulfate proteoglycan 5b isoform X2 [Electrophorus electricus]